MRPESSLSKFSESTQELNVTYVQRLDNRFQCINGHPCNTKDAQHFQPEQKLLLQELVQHRYDFESGGRCHVNEVFVPRLAGILEGLVNVLLRPFPQVLDFR